MLKAGPIPELPTAYAVKPSTRARQRVDCRSELRHGVGRQKPQMVHSMHKMELLKVLF